jgi:hypothetical protein
VPRPLFKREMILRKPLPLQRGLRRSVVGQHRQTHREHNGSGHPSIAWAPAWCHERPQASATILCRPANLFGHLFGEGQQGRWDLEAKRVRDLEVDQQLELRWLHNGQFGRLLAL